MMTFFKGSLLVFLFCLFCFFQNVSAVYDESSSNPQQIHLSFGRNPLEVVVTWTTYVESDKAVVQFSEPRWLNYTSVHGETTRFVDGGKEKRVHFIHKVLITNLKPRTTYEYRCGCHARWSGFYSFKTFTMDHDVPVELLVFGDLGLKNGQSIPRLRSEVLSGKIDAIIHAGDMAYNMDDDESRIGDEFMRKLEPIAAYLPYQVCTGNHEQE